MAADSYLDPEDTRDPNNEHHVCVSLYPAPAGFSLAGMRRGLQVLQLPYGRLTDRQPRSNRALGEALRDEEDQIQARTHLEGLVARYGVDRHPVHRRRPEGQAVALGG